MDLRRIAAFAVLAVLFAAPCSGVCTGWAASADARMACCIGKTADEATMCCASTEGRQNANPSGPLAVAALPALKPVTLSIAAIVPLPSAALIDLDAHDPLTNDSERHVLLSVFLI